MGKDAELAIVFADVVGSTQLYEQLGDSRARDMVGRCLEIMRDVTESNNGTVVKTIGDEVMATLDEAAQVRQSGLDRLAFGPHGADLVDRSRRQIAEIGVVGDTIEACGHRT